MYALFILKFSSPDRTALFISGLTFCWIIIVLPFSRKTILNRSTKRWKQVEENLKKCIQQNLQISFFSLFYRILINILYSFHVCNVINHCFSHEFINHVFHGMVAGILYIILRSVRKIYSLNNISLIHGAYGWIF